MRSVQDGPAMTELPIVDAHQHFWDLERNYLPWLCDERADPVPLRRLRRAPAQLPARGLRPRCRRAPRRQDGLRRDRVGPGRSGRRDAAGSQEMIAATGLSARHRRRRPARRSGDRGGARGPCRRSRGCAASGTSPRPPPSPDRVGEERAGLDGRSGLAARLRAAREIRPVVRPADALVAPRRGGRTRARLSRTRRSSSTTPACRPTAAPKASPAGARRWRRSPPRPTSRSRSRASGSPGEPWTVAANRPIVLDTIAIFGVERCMFASNFPVDGLCADFDTIFNGLQGDRRRPRRGRPAPAVPRQRGPDLPPGRRPRQPIDGPAPRAGGLPVPARGAALALSVTAALSMVKGERHPASAPEIAGQGGSAGSAGTRFGES